jgi:hypothetical protein
VAYSLAVSDVLIACSDGRIIAALDRLQAELELSPPHRLFVPGGPLVLARPGMERRVALDCLTTLIDGQQARRVVLVSHQQCLAYERALGGLGFDQQELLERDLRRVRTVIESAFPAIEVECYFIPWRENGDGAGFGAAERVE